MGRCDQLAQRAGGYSGCNVIKTTEASSTPNASKPAVIWPAAMLSKVVAAMADPINSGMRRFRYFDFVGEDPDVTLN
jgi:hypothetical protein